MPLGERLRALWRSVAPSEPSPDELVVITFAPYHEGPMIVSALEAAGIRAVADEVSRLPGQLPAVARIVVRQRDVPTAEEILQDLRS